MLLESGKAQSLKQFSKTEDSSNSSNWNGKRIIESTFLCLQADLKISS